MPRLKQWLHAHPEVWVMSYFLFYLAAFFVLEQITEPRYILHCGLDDIIPFSHWAILPYAFWYVWMPGSVLFLLFKDKADYLRLCFIMFTGMTVCLALYAVLPTGLALRRPLPHEDLLCGVIGLLRSVDPPANVCPSIHISSTVAICIVALRSRLLAGRRGAKALVAAVTLLITLSTLLLQQHSVWDVAAGAALSLALAVPAYRICWERAFPQKQP